MKEIEPGETEADSKSDPYLQCPFCGKQFVSYESIYKHIDNKHAPKTPEENQ
jgi:uncharacterized C2H2 Zn-finger protein